MTKPGRSWKPTVRRIEAPPPVARRINSTTISAGASVLAALVAIGAAFAAFQQVSLSRSAPRTQALLGARVEACGALVAAATGAERETHTFLAKYGDNQNEVDPEHWERVEDSQANLVEVFHRYRVFFGPEEEARLQQMRINLLNLGMVAYSRTKGLIAGFDKDTVDSLMESSEEQIRGLQADCQAQLAD